MSHGCSVLAATRLSNPERGCMMMYVEPSPNTRQDEQDELRWDDEGGSVKDDED